MSPTETEIVVEPESTLGRFKVHVGELMLPMSTEGDGTPRMRDLEWARMLGLERPRNIRKLVRKMIKDDKLQEVNVRFPGKRASMPKGGTRAVEAEEFWLTREQCLLVATQSGAPNAWKLTRLMVQVFEAVLRIGGVDAVRAVLSAQPAAPAAPPPSRPWTLNDGPAIKEYLRIVHEGQDKLEAKRALLAAEKLERQRAVEAEMAEYRRALEARMLARQHALDPRKKRKN